MVRDWGVMIDSEKKYLSIDEFDIPGALRVTVTGSVFCTSLVPGVLGQATVGIHLGEVEGSIETAGQVGEVDVKCELLVEELEHLILRIAGHHIDTRADVLATGVGGDKLEREGVTASGDTIRARVVSTVEGTIGGAGLSVSANSRIEGVSGVAVGVVADFVEPAPVRVESDLALGLGSTAGFRAFLPGKSGVGLCRVGANLLAAHHSDE